MALDFTCDIREWDAAEQFRKNNRTGAGDQYATGRCHANVAGNVARTVTDTNHTNTLTDEVFRLFVVV